MQAQEFCTAPVIRGKYGLQCTHQYTGDAIELHQQHVLNLSTYAFQSSLLAGFLHVLHAV